MRHPDFRGGYMTSVWLRLHKHLEDRYGAVTEVFLTCEYQATSPFEPSEDGIPALFYTINLNPK